MDIQKCLDPEAWINPAAINFPSFNVVYKDPSNTFYPPGVICATENTNVFCSTAGESGSPLMIKDSKDKFSADGILSFTKGCGHFAFNSFDDEGKFHHIMTNTSQSILSLVDSKVLVRSFPCLFSMVLSKQFVIISQHRINYYCHCNFLGLET